MTHAFPFAVVFASLLIGVAALKSDLKVKDKDVIFVSGSTSDLLPVRSAEIVENWKRAEGIYSCEEAAARLSKLKRDADVDKRSALEKLVGKAESKSEGKVIIHVQSWCPNLVKKFPKFVHVADPLSGQKKNGTSSLDTVLPKGMCGMLLAADSKSTQVAAATKYASGEKLKTWHVPSVHLGHYKQCKLTPLTTGSPSHKVLIKGMPSLNSKVKGKEAAFNKEQSARLEILTNWAVEMQQAGVKLEVIGEESTDDVAAEEGSSFKRKPSDAVAAAKAECDKLKDVTMVVLWDECNSVNGVRASKPERTDCYNFGSAHNMLTAQYLGIPVFGIGKVEAWKEVVTDPEDLQEDPKKLVKHMEKLLRDNREYFRAHQQAAIKSKEFGIEHVIDKHYEPMVADALENCPH